MILLSTGCWSEFEAGYPVFYFIMGQDFQNNLIRLKCGQAPFFTL
jgi:hypothetical protein